MATFEYRCPAPECRSGGRFEIRRPIGSATGVTACPECGADAIRVFSPPLVSLAPRRLVAAIDRAERSRTDPDVVGAPPQRPAGRRTPVARNPALQRLPRP